MASRWNTLFRALTSDTMDTVDTVSGRTAPAHQTVKSVESVYSQNQRKESDGGLCTNSNKRIDGPFAIAFAAIERRCPDYVEANRWQQAVEDGHRFLGQWGDQAASLGWTAQNLFGLHVPPEQPHPSYDRLSRYDQTGLVWLLGGRLVVALTETSAAIQSSGGTRLVYRRAR
jgi:hypothetical protein